MTAFTTAREIREAVASGQTSAVEICRASLSRIDQLNPSLNAFNHVVTERAIARAGLFEPKSVCALLAKCQKSLDSGIGETDEMALCGVLSTMLLHQQFIEDPILAKPVRPTRIVVGDQLRTE